MTEQEGPRKFGLNGTIAYYDAQAANFAERGQAFFDGRHMSAFAALLPPKATVLDAGCGYGRDMGILANTYGFNVVGIDLSQGLLQVARQQHPDLQFRHGDIRRLPFPDQSFDGVWSNVGVVHLESVDDVRQALAEDNRVLKQNGAMHLLVKAQTGKEKFEVTPDSLSNNPRFFQYFTLDEINSLLGQAGFSIEHIEQYREIDMIPVERGGRPNVELIWALARKTGQANPK